MNSNVSIEDLRKVIALQDLPDEHLQWILERSEYKEYEDGDVLVKTGEQIESMWILLEGKVYFYMNVNGRLVFFFSFENNHVTGGVGGILPYSRMKGTPGTSYAVGRVRTLMLNKKYFKELEKINPDLIQRLIGYMTERARIFATTQMQQEKVSALGRLAAGIAHELNNPAAAINRISSELNKRLHLNFEFTEEMLKKNISPNFINRIRTMISDKQKLNGVKNKISPMQRVRQEDEINDWLNSKGIDEGLEIAGTLTDSGFSIEDLEKINKEAGDEALRNTLYWLENLLSSELIIKDLENASAHISMLVDAIKSHVHLDRSGDLHHTDIHKDIENTLVLLEYKIREKNIRVNKNFCDNMPPVEAYIGEMNQVWTNIIDNAIYAVSKNGEVTVETSCDMKEVTVRIIDNGTGIPQDIITRIFDPFFTTKKMGEGNGIGLDIVHNVVKRHRGDVKVNSMPGRTEFVVTFPVSQKLIREEKKNEAPVHNNN